MTSYNNRKMGWNAKLALALIVLFGTSQSYAACTQGDLTGTWYLNGVTGDTDFGIFWEIDFCKIKFNSEGKVVRSASQCQYRDYGGIGDLNITGGTLVLTPACNLTGRIRYDDGEITSWFNIDAARLDKGKTVMTMVGSLGIDPFVVSAFTGAKM